MDLVRSPFFANISLIMNFFVLHEKIAISEMFVKVVDLMSSIIFSGKKHYINSNNL